MALPREKSCTFADLLEWDDDTRYELIDGQPRALSAPGQVHQEILTALLLQIGGYLRGKKCKIYPAPFDVRLFEKEEDDPDNVDTVVQPDLMVVCDKEKVGRRGIRGAPDLIIEILSSSSRRHDRLVKFNLYQRADVKEYWIVDPDKKLVLVHTLDEGKYPSPEVYTAQDTVPVGVLEGCSVDLAAVFPEEA